MFAFKMIKGIDVVDIWSPPKFHVASLNKKLPFLVSSIAAANSLINKYYH